MKQLLAALALLLLLPLAAAPAALADDDDPVLIISPPDDDAADNADHHAGYYYPAPDSRETYVGHGRQLEEADRRVRIGFVVGLEQEIAKRGYPVPYAVFAKGSDAQKMIMVALMDGPLDTLYRARGALANLTAEARLLPILKQNGVEDSFNFYDLLILLGYKQITITDGKTWAHQVKLVQP